MTTPRASTETRTTEGQPTTTKDLQNDGHTFTQRVGWKALFGFTTKKHLPLLFSAIAVAVTAAAILPAQAVLFNLIFGESASYAVGDITGPVLLHNASNLCLCLTALGIGCWFATSIYFGLFTAFGKLQARSTRERIFNHLIHKDIGRYDTRGNGIAAILPSVHM